MRPACLLAALVALALAALPAVADEPRGLDIHWIDTEGGAATLIVTPAGESVLIDCGNPGGRDADRIHKVASQIGLKQIDHLIITHWHGDHYGGVARLSRLLPNAAASPKFGLGGWQGGPYIFRLSNPPANSA